MSVIFEGIDMQDACTSVIITPNPGGWNDSRVEMCEFYNICKHRNTIKTNYKPDDCPLKPVH